MKDAQNKFYSSISNYYSEIFPYKPAQLQFVKKQLGQISGKKILDIGCATGELSYQLAQEGAEVTGIDLNPDLIAQAKNSQIHPDLHFQVGNMLELTNVELFSNFKREPFGGKQLPLVASCSK